MNATTNKPLRTTSKEVKTKIQNYILDCINTDGFDVDVKTEEEKINFLIDEYRRDYVFKDNLLRYKTYQNLFIEWIMGLPSCFNVHYTNFEILELVKEWNGYVPPDNKVYDTIENFRRLIFRELCVLARKYKVEQKLYTL